MRLFTLAAAALALAACAPTETRPSAPLASAMPTPAFETLRARKTEMARAFAAQASYCFARQDTDHPVFHGCIDWHSSTHGAWAMTAYQRATGDTQYAAQLDTAFDPAKLALEVEHLRSDPAFERPYGRAWFLRLATTWKALHPRDTRLDALAEEAARSLITEYQTNAPNPLREEYANPSWALVNLLLYARARHDTALEAQTVALVRANFIEPRCDLALEQRGFMSVCVTWAWLVSEALPDAEFRTWYARWNPGIETLTPVVAYPSAHDYGRNFSRAWGLYHLAVKLNEPRLRELYAAHVTTGFDPDTRWKGDYNANGHWVAQFGMLAIEPLFGD